MERFDCGFERKSDKVRRLVADDDVKGALRLAKDFRLGITLDQRNSMKDAYECMVHPSMYKQLRIDIDKKIIDGLEVLTKLYGQ